jgi:hypothetical protein
VSGLYDYVANGWSWAWNRTSIHRSIAYPTMLELDSRAFEHIHISPVLEYFIASCSALYISRFLGMIRFFKKHCPSLLGIATPRR